MKKSPRFEESSGNVFADLGLPNAEELQAKADLAFEISRTIEERKLTQAEAAEILGVDQPKVSALVRGRLSGFSMERLYRFLNALGRDVEIVVQPVSRRGSSAGLRVVTNPRAVAVVRKVAAKKQSRARAARKK
jgi:predicted XRE-type DNA-binding protein